MSIGIHVDVPSVACRKRGGSEPSAAIRQRVAAASEAQTARFDGAGKVR